MDEFMPWSLPGGRTAIAQASARPSVARALAWINRHPDFCSIETRRIAHIAAPTLDEGERARYVDHRLRELGAADVHLFGSSNVSGRLGPADGRGVALLAHLDTVFSATTDHRVTCANGRLLGPGVGDNSAGIAGILTVLVALRESCVELSRPLWLVGNIGEEGLGDLRGSRETMSELDGRLAAVIAVEGTMLGRLGHIAVGSRRLRVCFRAEGGHSWLDFGKPSAVHAAVTVAARIAQLDVPAEPRTTFNIGSIEGGDGVNVVAHSAEFVLDLRSVSAPALQELVRRVGTILDDACRKGGVEVSVDVVGNRPAGMIPRTHPLIEASAAAIESTGVRAEPTAGSTDANVPLSLGIPAVALGITRGSGIHSLSESIEIEPMRQGVKQLVLLCAALCGPDDG